MDVIPERKARYSRLSISHLLILCICIQRLGGEVAKITVPGIRSWSVKKKNASVTKKWDDWFNFQYWHVCSAFSTDIADSYLTLPYIRTWPAAEIHVKLTYGLEDCSISFNPKRCQLGISLYVKRNNGALPGEINPVTTHFKKIGVISNYAAIGEIMFTKLNRVIKLGMQEKSGIYLSFRDTGTCGKIFGVAVTYYKCPLVLGNLIKFQASIAPNSTTAEKLIAGECVANAIPISTAKDNVMRCFANGTATFSGGCHCVKGYEKIGQSCSTCLPKYFKSTAGNEACTKCGLHVEDGSIPRDKICKCKRGFFRPTALTNDPAANCEDPPSAPVNLEILNINSTSATVKWERPRHNGTGNQISYLLTVTCERGFNHVISDIRTKQLSYELKYLKTHTNYNVTIYSVNNVTTATGQRSGKSIGFKTKLGLPSKVRDVTKIRNDDGSVTVKWREPAAKGGPELKYRVRYGGKTIMTVNTNITLPQTSQRQEYTVKIDSHTNAGYSNLQEIFVVIFGRLIKVPSEVRDVSKIINDDGSVTVKWREPEAKGGPDLKYRVRYGGKTIMTVNTNITLPQTDQRQEYTIQIDSHTNAGYSNVQEIFVEIFGRPTKETSNPFGIKLAVHVGYGLSIFILVAVFTAGIFKYRRKKHEEKVVQFSDVRRETNFEETIALNELQESNYTELYSNNREYEEIYTGLTNGKENKPNEEKVQYSNISTKH